MSADLQYVPQAEGHVSPFGRAVDEMRVAVDAAGGRLFGEVRGWYEIRIAVDDDYARETPDAELERRLEGLAKLLFVARTREYYRLMDVHLEPNPVTLRRMRDDLEDSTEDRPATGRAAGGAVEVTSIGMRHFTVSLAPGTGRALGGEGLGQALTEAANAMVASWLHVLADYKRERWSR